QPADDLELESREDEQPGRARAGHETSVVRSRDGFQCAGGRRADGDDATLLVERLIDRERRRSRDVKSLGLQPMIFDLLNAHWLKRAVSQVQRDLGSRDTA